MAENISNANIFYRIPGHRGTRIATFPCERVSLNQFRDYISATEGLPDEIYTISHGTRLFSKEKKSFASNQNGVAIASEKIKCPLEDVPVAKSYYLTNNSSVDILFSLKGGKGGFGSLLRAIGAQIEKTTNRDACRDLSGRRLRDVKREQDLRKLLALQAKLKQEKARRRREKLERLKRNYLKDDTSDDPNGTSLDHNQVMYLAQKFDDPEYNRRRSDMPSVIDAACKAGLKNLQKRIKLDQEESTIPDEPNEKPPSFEDLLKEAKQVLAETSENSITEFNFDVEFPPNNDKKSPAGDTSHDTNPDAIAMKVSSDHSDIKQPSSVTTKNSDPAAKKKLNPIYNLWLGADDGDDEDDEDENEDNGEGDNAGKI